MRPLWEWDWVVRNSDRIWEQTVEHLVLTVSAVGLGFLVSLGLAAVALRFSRSYGPISSVGSVLYTIPSLAAFVLLLPFTRLSVWTAIIPLTGYTVLIFVRNIVTGIAGVSDEVREAALGMGYGRGRLFLEIELPLAVPAIITGFRIATVTVISLITVTALMGMGGLGSFILAGFSRSPFHPTMIFVGTILAVALATVLDLGLFTIQRLLTPWARRAEAA
jgi:osmoprotectant transport system permease protein